MLLCIVFRALQFLHIWLKLFTKNHISHINLEIFILPKFFQHSFQIGSIIPALCLYPLLSHFLDIFISFPQIIFLIKVSWHGSFSAAFNRSILSWRIRNPNKNGISNTVSPLQDSSKRMADLPKFGAPRSTISYMMLAALCSVTLAMSLLIVTIAVTAF